MASTIEWTDETWNPVTGCSKVSPGCKHCYAETIAKRFWKGRKFTDVQTHADRLEAPMHWKKPRMVFVNSMSDLFHEDVPDEFIDRVFAVMALCPQHTFQVLTKRAKRMQQYCSDADGENIAWTSANMRGLSHYGERVPWPLPNVWLGVSCEDQPRFDERFPFLVNTPAAVRFISYEPALGPLDISRHRDFAPTCLDWLIVGGESGHGARPCDVAWIRSIIEQCKEAAVACFVKQLGSNPVGVIKPDAKKGGDPEEWPECLRVRQFPERVHA